MHIIIKAGNIDSNDGCCTAICSFAHSTMDGWCSMLKMGEKNENSSKNGKDCQNERQYLIPAQADGIY